jgi:isoquinoline 1-oxidoreductase beta subunit
LNGQLLFVSNLSTMNKKGKIARRDFLKVSAVSGIGLILGGSILEGNNRKIVNLSSGGTKTTSLNAFIEIDSTGLITLYNHRPEMGQGTFESIPMIVAEELEVPMDQIRIVQSAADRKKYGDQMVVGSRSIQGNYDWMRTVGASAREMLIAAAAASWNVPASDCYAEKAMVYHRESGRSLTYGQLAQDAGQLPVPKNPKLKDPSAFKIIGKSVPRSDVPVKINGEAKYGIDCEAPGMLFASVEHSPLFLARLVSFDDTKAKAVPGVRMVLKTQRNVLGHTREGVAVLADNYWAALQGRKALALAWDTGGLENWTTQKIAEDYQKASSQDAVTFKKNGDFDQTYGTAKIKVEASYSTPYQTHAPMEPMNALVSVEKDRCIYWGSTQNPNGVKSQLARQCNMAEENVTVNYTLMGGGFGRRSMTDIAEEAADLSIKSGKPVKVIWTREDDLTQGPFRACSLNQCRGVVDEQGNLLALEHKVICQEIQNQTGDNAKAGGSIAGGINTEYSIPNVAIRGILRKLYIPIYYWRSVYHSTNCFAHESFIDELAVAARKDPIEFRLAMLKHHRRYTQILHMVAEKTQWFGPRTKDVAKGVSIIERSGAFVATVVEVARTEGKLSIQKVTAVIDCGKVVNPDIVQAQTEGAIVMGLTACCISGLTIDRGQVAEKNFNTYKMLLIHECPATDVIVAESDDPPEGAGEAGLPGVAPALTNAIFSLTGKRIRTLPFKLAEV